ncbi:MAG: Hsp70 family protein [Spirochaetaceae bacterium]|nr:Hsp70 family protein [Spirochaetaceae bacterium]
MYGIDFGTSNTVVTVREGSSSRVLDLGEGGVLPSLMYFERDRRASVGSAAVADYAQALDRWRDSGNLYSRFRFFQALKFALRDRYFEGSSVFGEYMTAERLVAVFLREVKRRADEECGGGDDRLVVGRPVALSTEPEADGRLQERFRKACLLAGFSEVEFVLEPVAAAVDSLGLAEVEDSGPVLVFDFGGGTLDISIARRRGTEIKILANAGRNLGGYLLNEDISRARLIRHFGAFGRFRTMTGRELEMPRWITDQVASFYALPLSDIAKTRSAIKDLLYDARRQDKDKLRGLAEFLDRNLAFDLFARIDRAKIELSSGDESTIAYSVPPFLALVEKVMRREFEAMIAPRVEEARRLTRLALERAALAHAQIAAVVRVGGSCRVPAFVAMLEEDFPGRVREGAVFTSIASGLLEARDRGLTSPAALEFPPGR